MLFVSYVRFRIFSCKNYLRSSMIVTFLDHCLLLPFCRPYSSKSYRTHNQFGSSKANMHIMQTNHNNLFGFSCQIPLKYFCACTIMYQYHHGVHCTLLAQSFGNRSLLRPPAHGEAIFYYPSVFCRDSRFIFLKMPA